MKKTFRKTLSLLLAVLMIATTLPTFVLANETADEVVYNLGKQEITVGNDSERATVNPWGYKLFDENGNYTIELEDNAFFPYEVQFQANGITVVEWFDTPESTVDFGGHTFSVYSEQNDDTKIQQIGVWIDGQYVAARPKAKEFTNPMIQPMSLLPLAEIAVALDLSAYNRYQFSNVAVSVILSEMKPSQIIDGGDKVAWARFNSDDYQIVTQADKIDLSEMVLYSQDFKLELIVGSALQLDSTNTKYIVEVTTNITDLIDEVEVYTESSGNRSIASFENTDSDNSANYCYYDFYLAKTASAQDYYLGVKFNTQYTSYDVKAIEGSFSTAEEAISAATTTPALDVTDKLINQTLTNTGTGLEFSFDPTNNSYFSQNYTLVIYSGNDIVGHCRLYISLGISCGVSFEDLYDNNNDSVAYYSYGVYSPATGLETINYTMDSTSYSANAEYYLRFVYIKDGKRSFANRSYVTKAVLGHYNSLEEANSQSDIKDQLFPANSNQGSGYKANFSGAGKNFTVFAEEEVYKFTVKTIDASTTPTNNTVVPDPGNDDTYFQVYDATELSNTYVLPSQHDSYYDMGYQTVFYTDDESLSALRPIFWAASGISVYSGHSGSAGTKQESGTTSNDFSNGAVQYAVPATDGKSLKNYWITFVKKHTGGSKLFVNGINGGDGTKREVFLNSVYSNQHDIFIANVGDAQLTGLTVTLSGAQNIKLDPYWTVGGSNNNTLGAFVTTSSLNMSNIAKIRLLPDGEGAISGTLTIKANDQSDVDITLTGNAGDPKLTTAAIPDAVKFVPYGVQILHNNKYPWNKVTMSITSGSLPAGMTLKENGELYGVPTATGTFKFTVQMKNSDTRFGRSSAQYTLVVNENTDANVDAKNDTGYGVVTRIPDMTVISDQELILEGPFAEFIDLWLNGVKLTRNVDYTAASGSTKITVKSQTFISKGLSGTNTIAGEYRDANDEVKTGAQNYTQSYTPKPPSGSGGSSGTGGSSGSGGSSAATSYTVIFVTGDTDFMKNKIINSGDKLSDIGTPSREGYTFDGWYKDSDLTQPYDEDTIITENMTLYAKWNKSETHSSTATRFFDVDESDWFYSDVDWAFINELMFGTSSSTWGPDSSATQGMIVTVLARLAKADITKYADLNIPGIPEDQWFTLFAKWAYTEGLMEGINLSMTDEIIREDVAIILVRFLEYLGIEFTVADESIIFADADSISDDAMDALQILCKIGIFNGIGNNTMDPKRSLKRAELAALLHRTEEFIEESSDEESDEETE